MLWTTETVAARLLNHLQPLFLLALRLWVSWQFLKSGWLKLTDWDSTLFLFQEEYRVPLLSPELAAFAGTFGELFFSLLLAFGVLSRVAAIGLSAVNVLAVVSYAHVLLSSGFEAALAQHFLWGLMLLTVVIFGPGKLSLQRESPSGRFALPG
ncbi:MAG: DoxX family protein [Gammaproteobacteria bacterium]|nr:DoxX family protein [Gammaproteobacteria bacterium]MCP5138351.1 DoxX family protein [Chromatiales bacterium]